MRTIIVTFHNAYNFGAVLQTYALQYFLKMNFGDVQVLDYKNPKILASYKYPCFKSWFHHPISAFIKVLQTYLFRKKYKKIDIFIKNNLNLTYTTYTRENISKAINEGDVFVTGSDQVWNSILTGGDPTYLLDFCDGKIKVSYAASFGTDSIPKMHVDSFKSNLSKIDYLSLREEKGNDILKDLLGINKPILVDPTLLLKKEFWDNLSENPDIDFKYILVYKITNEEHLFSFASMLSKETGLPILFIPNNAKKFFGKATLFNVGPTEWLGYIKNASYVITNSFHGTVFSIIFKKKFFVDISSKNIASSRQMTLLKLFGLNERIISNYKPELLNNELDNNIIENILRVKRDEAFGFFANVYNNKN